MASLVYCPVKSIPPVGRELNFECSSSELHVHNDVHTLLNLKKKIEDANVINGFLSRMNQPNIDVSDVPTGNRFCLGCLINLMLLNQNCLSLKKLKMMLKSRIVTLKLRLNTISFVRNMVFNV